MGSEMCIRDSRIAVASLMLRAFRTVSASGVTALLSSAARGSVMIASNRRDAPRVDALAPSGTPRVRLVFMCVMRPRVCARVALWSYTSSLRRSHGAGHVLGVFWCELVFGLGRSCPVVSVRERARVVGIQTISSTAHETISLHSAERISLMATVIAYRKL